ncbi:MAG: DUF86 domain-containing protein [Proteobacteria bacterium]|nr:DUF86 domain-containing protein [Pseudomonadota bacterium]
MTRHDDGIRLQDMLDHAREAVAMIEGKERADLERERMLELSLIRLIEVVGEAAARVSPTGQARYPSIPWSQVVGMRNRLIHGYSRVEKNLGLSRLLTISQ